MKTNYTVFTEVGRERGRISATILKFDTSTDSIQIVTEYSYPNGSNKGAKSMTIAKLVEVGELPTECIDDAGYRTEKVHELCNVLIVEGRGLNYFSII